MVTIDGRRACMFRDRSVDEVRDIAIARRISNAWSASKPVHGDGWQISGCPVNGRTIAVAGRDRDLRACVTRGVMHVG
jgi:hypothetical protein